jgi:hypothetical protein
MMYCKYNPKHIINSFCRVRAIDTRKNLMRDVVTHDVHYSCKVIQNEYPECSITYAELPITECVKLHNEGVEWLNEPEQQYNKW